MNNIWLIVGLGNPGSEFVETRHNAGFIIVDEIVNGFDTKKPFKTLCNGLITETIINDKKCIFLKPQTFMNNSGESVLGVANYFKIPLNRIIILHDDVNFDIGKIKIKQDGSAGGHKGVNSIIETFNNTKFTRIRIGVNNKPNSLIDLKDWVVSKFSSPELCELKKCSTDIFDAIKFIIDDQIIKAMNKYNG